MYYQDKLDFYFNKCNLKKEDISNNLEKIKSQIMEKKQREIDGLKYLTSVPINTRYSSSLVPSQATYQKLVLLEKEMKYLKTCNTEQFFRYMTKIESYCWVNFLQKSEILKNNHEKDLNKFKESNGLIKKTAKIFGFDNKVLDKKQKLLDVDNKQIDNYTKCRDEWSKLSFDDRIYFICGRYLSENVMKLDKKDLDDYLQKVEQEKEIEQNNQIQM